MLNTILKYFKKISSINYLLFFTILICLLTLLGWIFDIHFLKNFSSGNVWIKMLPIAAIALIIFSLAIFFKIKNKFKNVAIISLLIFLFLGLASIINSISRTDLFQLKLLGIRIKPTVTLHVSSLEFVLLCTSILLLFTTKKYFHILSELLASIAFLIAAFFFIGYVYEINEMQGFYKFSSISIQTTVCMILLSFVF